jgi:hypothetical protein
MIVVTGATGNVERILYRPAATFAEWAARNVAAFS